MIPIILSISGFLSYREPVVVNFTGFNLACIAGHNGAGKSSLLDAITWALFGKARKSDDSLINTGSTTAQVSFEFEYENNKYRVQRAKTREKTAMLEFNILHHDDDGHAVWRPLTEYALTKTQERINTTLRMDYETFINASFFLQGKADQFTTQKAGDRKKILGSILGLEIWDEYRNRAAERRKKLEIEINTLDGRLKEINAELADETRRREKLAEVSAELAVCVDQRKIQDDLVRQARQTASALQEQAKWVENAQQQFEAARNRLFDRQQRRIDLSTELSIYTETLAHAAEIEAVHAEWQLARTELEKLERTAGKYRENERLREVPRSTIETKRALLVQESERLGSLSAEYETKKRDAASLLEKIAATQDDASQAEQQVDRRKQLEGDLQLQRERVAEIKQINSHLREEMEALKERIRRLESTEGAECPLCGQPLADKERAALIERLQNEGAELGDRFRANSVAAGETESSIRQLEAEIEVLRPADAALRMHSAQLGSLQNQMESLEKSLREWETSGSVRLAAILASLEREDFEPEARLRLSEIEAALEAMGYDPAVHEEIRSREEAGRAGEERLRALEKARAALKPLEREVADLDAQIAEAEIEAEKLSLIYEGAAASLENARATAPDLLAAEDMLYRLMEQENQLRSNLGAAQLNVDVLKGQKEKRIELETRRENLAIVVSQYKQLERAFSRDGVPALLIEQALPEIETRANEILTRLSDGSMSVRFVTQEAYKDKSRDDLRETLAIQISDGAGTREYELFSGGEAFRVNFAIRLALSEVLAQRAGARLQTLVIDEGFGSQDTQGRQRLIEAINLVRTDFAKILVITHIEELKDAFPNRIEIEKGETGSTIRMM